MPTVRAWKPGVGGIAEVLHAQFEDHAYPLHTHATWTLLIVDDGAIRYDLDRHDHGAARTSVTLLPPHVPHNGRSATDSGFRKRVIYLDEQLLDPGLIGAAADAPTIHGADLRAGIHRLHRAIDRPGDEFEAENRLALIIDRLRNHLRPSPRPAPECRDISGRLRELLDAHVTDGVSLATAAAVLGTDPSHLVRAFTRRFGLPPHRYLIGRRIERARSLLLDGVPPAVAAVTAGFYDQAHFHRHFVRHHGVTPGTYAGRRRRAG